MYTEIAQDRVQLLALVLVEYSGSLTEVLAQITYPALHVHTFYN
jgi:hypothetical protein